MTPIILISSTDSKTSSYKAAENENDFLFISVKRHVMISVQANWFICALHSKECCAISRSFLTIRQVAPIRKAAPCSQPRHDSVTILSLQYVRMCCSLSSDYSTTQTVFFLLSHSNLSAIAIFNLLMDDIPCFFCLELCLMLWNARETN